MVQSGSSIPARTTGTPGVIRFPKTVDPSSPEFEFFHDVVATAFLQGGFTDKIEFTSGQTVKIKHKLGRKFQGYFPVYINADATFYVDESNTRPDSEIWLTNSLAGTVTAQFWIF